MFRSRLIADVGQGALALCLLCACSAGALALAPAQALASTSTPAASVSANWAGYVALPSSSGASHFSAVSGSWTEPTVTCTPGRDAYSATWVGLGGYREQSNALEQVGSDADCARSGQALYSLWYELLPAAAVDLKLAVHPGDEVEASVSVKGEAVTLRISDVTTGGHFASTKRVARIDDSLAEWIVEAPSGCVSEVACSILPLADFDTVAFSSATATIGRHTGSAVGPHWSTAALELEQHALSSFRTRQATAAPPPRALTLAIPSSSSTPYGSFTVSWQEQQVSIERPTPPTLPGFGGGAPA